MKNIFFEKIDFFRLSQASSISRRVVAVLGKTRRGAATSTSWVSFGSRGVWRSPCEFIAAPLPFSPSPSNVAALGSLNARQPVRWFIHRPQPLDDCPPARRKRPRKPSAWFGSVGEGRPLRDRVGGFSAGCAFAPSSRGKPSAFAG